MAVSIEIKPEAKVSRLEVIIRIPVGIVLMIIAGILGIIAGILWVINVITCLILAKRVAAEFMAAYVKWTAQINAYFMLVVDTRPPWFPDFK